MQGRAEQETASRASKEQGRVAGAKRPCCRSFCGCRIYLFKFLRYRVKEGLILRPHVYLWKKKHAGLGLSELRELRQLREENRKLKRLVAELSLGQRIL